MKIGFIGCGNMASAMIEGILKKGIYKKEEIIVSNLTEAGAARSRERLGVVVTRDNREVAAHVPVLVLAVKPQFYEEVICQVRDLLTPEHLVVGIAPGKTLSWLEEQCGQPLRIARMMPNTPAMVGEGMTGLCVNERVREEDIQMLSALSNSFGRTELVPERLMDAVGAVSGSSPAYVYMFIEAMADAAVAQGMPRTQAYSFAAQAVLGSAKMVLEGGRHPGELKDMVCSPGGTTIEGVRTLERLGMRSAVFEALTACAEKGKKL
jgi:pyrroline-5-carboxylate reductase